MNRSIAFIALLAAGCRAADSVPLPPATRGAPDAELISACAGPTDVSASAALLQRSPYLQQVTATSAVVVWTTSAAADASVEVTRPDGTLVATFDSTVDATVRSSGTVQRIARLEQLAADTVYCYSIRDGGTLPVVARTGLRTAPITGGAPVRFVAFGDAGSGGADQLAVAGQLADFRFDLILMTGDIVYEEGSIETYDKNLFGVYRSLMRSIPLYPTSGNHDYEGDDAEAFREVFVLPDNGGPDGLERWYSFDRGPIHFVAYDTELSGETQAAWIDADLAATQQPWKIAFGHKPSYSSGEHGSDKAARKWFSPIFERHGVQLVLNGHDHDYERVHPQDGVTYVVTGGGGQTTRPVGESDFTAFSDEIFHFVQVEVEADQLTLHAIDATGFEFDSVRIPR